MDIFIQKDDANRLLSGLENGGLAPHDALILAEGLDPVLVYVIVSFLRGIYPASDPAATAVLERVVQLTTASPTMIRKHKAGHQDSVSGWFESEYSYGDYRGRGSDLVDLIVDKLES